MYIQKCPIPNRSVSTAPTKPHHKMTNATISDSEDDDVSIDIVGTPEVSENELVAPHSVLSIRNRDASKTRSTRSKGQDSAEDSIAIVVKGPARPWEYKLYDGTLIVESVLGETKGPNGSTLYKIEYESGEKDKLPLGRLILLNGGQASLDTYNDLLSSNSNEKAMASKRVRKQPESSKGFVNSATANLGSDDSEAEAEEHPKKRQATRDESPLPANAQRPRTRNNGRTAAKPRQDVDTMDLDSSSEDVNTAPVRATRSAARTSGNISGLVESNDEEQTSDHNGGEEEDEDNIAYERVLKKKNPPRAQRSLKPAPSKIKKGRPKQHGSSEEDVQPEPSRRSARDRPNQKSMREGDISDEMYADEPVKSTFKQVASVKEIFQEPPKNSAFKRVHNGECDSCGKEGSYSNKGPNQLLCCQGCTTTLHRYCIGNRSTREHVVTKVGDQDFVLQCRRCVGVANKKDHTAPRLGCCSACNEPGLSSSPFSKKLTSKQEEKLRSENGGVDPITAVSPDLINNVENVMFRCESCHRAYHFEHLPSLEEDDTNSDEDVDSIRDDRIAEYRFRDHCKDCDKLIEGETKVEKLVAWRPIKGFNFNEEVDEFESLREDQREYLVKWDRKSYLHCTWQSGGWVYGVCASAMRRAFANNQDGPVYTSEEAIPEDWLRVEVVLDVEWKSNFKPKNEAHGKANMFQVKSVYAKYSELTYDEIAWDDPPQKSEAARYSAYQTAFYEYLRGIFFTNITKTEMSSRLTKFRALDFAQNVEMKVQPAALTGGKLMDYQLEGANWMLYNFQQKKNVILADDMGLGKTIQVITFLASLIKQKPKCWPFLIVTPNSTCPNWRSELKKWAPDLRVVAFYGGKTGRDIVEQYELFANDSKTLAAHVVITSYECPVDKNSAFFFRGVPWVGLIVDEGQRLKNNENLLYKALQNLKTPFQVLLTGTPLQNNKLELFNLLHFLDPTMNARKLDEEYAEVNKQSIGKLRELVRPFFLRRTKGKVLNLPPMKQVILPVTMSFLQKKVCKSILEKNLDLIRSILGATAKKLKPQERGNLNNILMQLRKVLSHPFLYSSAIEENTNTEALAFRNLVEASSKFQLLESILPKLKERGHRVLIFSQFLEQLSLIERLLSGLGLTYSRLDGKLTALKKNKVINEYNAEGSEIFAMLLSTRAGGVGINLATADTVIIMDPDYNPHQDAQALSRAHRIGQKKPVVVFNLMTKNTAEEKIIQVGRKKLTLGVLIENMDDDEDDAGVDVETMLAHGAAALFDESNGEDHDIRYDSAAVDQLLDRTKMPVTTGEIEASKNSDGKSDGPEEAFAFAQIWVNDKATFSDDIGDADAPAAQISDSSWRSILEKREQDAKVLAEEDAATKGRGKRNTTKPSTYNVDDAHDELSPAKKASKKKGRKTSVNTDSDGDFAVGVAPDSEPEDPDQDAGEMEDPSNLAPHAEAAARGLAQPSKDIGRLNPTSSTWSQHAIVGRIRPEAQSALPATTVDGGTHLQQFPSNGASSTNGNFQSIGRDRSAYRSQPANGHAIEVNGVRSSISRPDFLGQRSHSGNNLTIGQSTSLDQERPSAPCHTCKLEHQDISRNCPRTMSNSKIRMLLDGLEPYSPKATTLRNQLRWILAARAEKKPVRT